MNELEREIRSLLTPVAGAYLRPWMSSSSQPERCKVWVVGANPAKPFPSSKVGSFESYIDALFNRNGQSIRELYNEITDGRPSPTRRNLDKVREVLEVAGIQDVLETNLNSYPTRMSSELSLPVNREGRMIGEAIFEALIGAIDPKVVWLHGAGTLKKFRRRFESNLPTRLPDGRRLSCQEVSGRLYVLTPCLALPAFNRWHMDFEDVIGEAAGEIGRWLRTN